MTEPDWITANRDNWDERVGIHLDTAMYDLSNLRAGKSKLGAIVEQELPDVSGKRILHLQCHFGRDTLTLAQHGAEVVGLDFSGPAIAAARTLTAELSLEPRARFVQANVYDAAAAVAEEHSFDLVFVTWGALCWLPDIPRWARIVASFLKPGGSLYLAEGHPAAMVLDDAVPQANGHPGFLLPYFHDEPLEFNETTDYADSSARITNSRTYEWIHPLGNVVTALIAAGLRLDWLHEHDGIPWQLFKCLTKGPDRLFRWPDNKWLPLAYSLYATLPESLPHHRENANGEF